MKLTTKARYGVRAMIVIAQNFNIKPTKRKSIVEEEDIPDSYLENILIALKNRGILHTIRGPHGGFVLNKAPEETTLLDIIEVLQGSLAPTECVDTKSICDRADSCVTRPIWAKLKEAQEEILGSVSLADLVRDSKKNLGSDYII